MSLSPIAAIPVGLHLSGPPMVDNPVSGLSASPMELFREPLAFKGAEGFISYEGSKESRVNLLNLLKEYTAVPKRNLQQVIDLIGTTAYTKLDVKKKKQAILQWVFKESELKAKVYAEPPSSDGEILDWFQMSWMPLLQDAWKEEHPETIRNLVRKKVLSLKGPSADKLIQEEKLDRLM